MNIDVPQMLAGTFGWRLDSVSHNYGQPCTHRSFAKTLLLPVLLLLLFQPEPLLAVQASPHAFTVTQPDGSQVTLHIRGDEYFHWEEDERGYTVMRDNGRYVYAQQDKKTGQLKPTLWQAGKADPVARGLKKRELPSPAIIRQLRSKSMQGPAAISSEQQVSAASATGTLKNLVVLVRFSDHVGRTLPSKTNMEVLFNAVGGDPVLAPTGSVRDVYTENSYGQLTLDSTVVDWFTVTNTEAYYADGVSGSSKLWSALREALDNANATINFNDFDVDNDGNIDAITFIHSGYGAEWGGTDAYGAARADRIWSHKWTIQPAWSSANGPSGVEVSNYHISPGVWGTSGSAIGRIGVIAHETGHFLGLPDLYDTDAGAGDGIGSWGMMANSWGFDGSQLYPPHFSPWSKIDLGWVTPTVISSNGTYNVPEVELTPTVYRIDAGYPTNEYLLIENRQPTGFDGAIPQGGLAIWHIDDESDFNTQGYPGQAGWPGNGNHYRVALLQADGDYDLEKGNNRGDAGDAYHGNGVSLIDENSVPSTDAYQVGSVGDSGNVISNISSSGPTMSFIYGPPPPDPTYNMQTERFETDWVDTVGGTQHVLDDDDSVIVPLGFTFDFYGVAETSVAISSNGYLTFGTDAVTGSNAALPDAAVPNEIVAPFWDDLDPSLGGTVSVLQQGTTPHRRTTFSWEDVRHAETSGAVSFQVTLYEHDSDIVFRYLDVDFGDAGYDGGNSATIGLEDVTGTDATLYSYNTAALGNGDAIRFSTLKDVLLVDDDDNNPDVSGYYTVPLDLLGATYDVWQGSTNEPDAATLAGYKSVIWFSGDKYGADAAGPTTAGETELATYLDAGACLFISSQDYHFDNGLTTFMSGYLGVSAVTDDQLQTAYTGAGVEFTGLGPYTPSFIFNNYSDIVNPDVTATVAFTADKGNVAVAKTTSAYATTFWGYPLELIDDAADRQKALDAALQFCANVYIDTDLDGSANSHDSDDDNDGLSDLVEVTVLATDPLAADTDGDGLGDFDEVNADGNPGDYLPGTDTDPLDFDTDGDGYGDGAELAAGSDPLDAGSIPVNDGDINGDGMVNIVDILRGQRVLLGLSTLTPGELVRADVAPVIGGLSTPDGQFTVGDLLLIQQKTLGLPSVF